MFFFPFKIPKNPFLVLSFVGFILEGLTRVLFGLILKGFTSSSLLLLVEFLLIDSTVFFFNFDVPEACFLPFFLKTLRTLPNNLPNNFFSLTLKLLSFFTGFPFSSSSVTLSRCLSNL